MISKSSIMSWKCFDKCWICIGFIWYIRPGTIDSLVRFSPDTKFKGPTKDKNHCFHLIFYCLPTLGISLEPLDPEKWFTFRLEFNESQIGIRCPDPYRWQGSGCLLQGGGLVNCGGGGQGGCNVFGYLLWRQLYMYCCGKSWKWHVLKTDLWWVRLTALVRRVWLKTLKSCLNVRLALCQTHCRQVPVFSRLSKEHAITWSNSATRVMSPSSCLRVNMGCALAILFQVRSLYVPTKGQVIFAGPFPGSP